jgi:hypothetical protein
LTLALDGGEMSASRPGRFIPGEISPGTHWMGGWVGFSVGLDSVEQRKNRLLLPEIEPRPSNP